MANPSSILAWEIPWTEDQSRPRLSGRACVDSTANCGHRVARQVSRMFSSFTTEAVAAVTSHSVRVCSVAQTWPALCDPMDGNTPGFTVTRETFYQPSSSPGLPLPAALETTTLLGFSKLTVLETVYKESHSVCSSASSFSRRSPLASFMLSQMAVFPPCFKAE